jgi:hypothetical protein
MSVTIKFTDSMHALLDWFEEQPCSCATIGHMNDEIEYSRETIRQNLQLLCAAGHAEVRHEPTGEYRLIEDPRDDELRGDGAGTIAPEADPIDDGTIERALAGWEPGTPGSDRERRLASARRMLEWLREQPEGRQCKEIEMAIGDELVLDSQKDFGSWWDRIGYEATRRARDAGIVELEGTDYKWIGDRGQ